ncbi:MAG: hypothetical protein JOY72_07210 [Actinobacteria bacterium]|nr:hypothetical protein [Actinomycetota bacterium]MBV8480078.1 hypothetical protein [Actinomycetota bacterium]
MALRRRRKELPPLAEGDVYARSYGDRSDEVTNIQRVPRPDPEPEPVAESRLSDRKLRDAFRSRLERREDD